MFSYLKDLEKDEVERAKTTEEGNLIKKITKFTLVGVEK